MEDFSDESLYQILGLAISRELNKRRRLEQYKTIEDAAKLLRERKNIMVITGAGISTSLGIPDFLRNQVEKNNHLRGPHPNQLERCKLLRLSGIEDNIFN